MIFSRNVCRDPDSGLTLARSVYVAKDASLHTLWPESYGIKLFRKTMPEDQLKNIQQCMRFDYRSTRQQRIEDGDKFAAISQVWNAAVQRFQVETFNYSTSLAKILRLMSNCCRRRREIFGLP